MYILSGNLALFAQIPSRGEPMFCPDGAQQAKSKKAFLSLRSLRSLLSKVPARLTLWGHLHHKKRIFPPNEPNLEPHLIKLKSTA
jgi:hypothetical protein